MDSEGNVYVADFKGERVLKLAAGTDKVTELPFTGLRTPRDVTVATNGDIFITDRGGDSGESRVLRLAVGEDNPTELSSVGLNNVTSVAVDPAGSIYVTDSDDRGASSRLLKLTPTEDHWEPIMLPGLEYPHWVTVDDAGNLYADDGGRKVVKLASGSNNWTDLVTEESLPDDVGLHGVATDSVGNVYAAAHVWNHGPEAATEAATTFWKVSILKFSAGSDTVTEFPMDDRGLLVDVAVDLDGNIYFTDEPGRSVLRLAP